MAMRGFVQLVYTLPVITVAIGFGYLGLKVPRHDEVQPRTPRIKRKLILHTC